MNRLVVDVSVGLKWAIPEAHREQAISLLSDENGLLAPDLFAVEMANALLKYLRRGEITSEHATASVEFALKAVRLYSSRNLVAHAINLAQRLELSAYDALYVALAQQEQCALVTADRKLYDRVAPAGPIDVIWVADIPGPPDPSPTG